MEYEKIKDYDNQGGMSLTEALAQDKRQPILRNEFWDAIIQNDALRKLYWDFLPAWTGTHIKYKTGETTALIWRRGQKPKRIPFPLKDGWYLSDKNGIPNGEPSDESNPKARKLYRYQDRDYDGLVVRGGGFDGDGARRRLRLRRRRPFRGARGERERKQRNP